jgi:hypothetical protein
MSTEGHLIISEHVHTVLIMHTQYLFKVSTTKDALVVEFVPSSECREFGTREFGKGVKIEAVYRQNYQVGGHTHNNESQEARQPSRVGGDILHFAFGLMSLGACHLPSRVDVVFEGENRLTRT